MEGVYASCGGSMHRTQGCSALPRGGVCITWRESVPHVEGLCIVRRAAMHCPEGVYASHGGSLCLMWRVYASYAGLLCTRGCMHHDMRCGAQSYCADLVFSACELTIAPLFYVMKTPHFMLHPIFCVRSCLAIPGGAKSRPIIPLKAL